MDPGSTRQAQHHHHHSPPPMMQGKDHHHHHHHQRSLVGAEKASDTMILQTNSPMPTNQDPVKWTREEVLNWLKWCQEEFSLDSVNAEKFTMNGKALCLMPKQSFCDRAPECGDILYELLQKLFRKECRFYHPNLSDQRRSPDPQFNSSSRMSGATEHQNVPGSPREPMGYQGNLTIPPSNSSPRLPMDLSAQPEKSNTPCSDSGHSSPDTAEDLRQAATNNQASAIHYRRQNAPPMITLTSSNRSSPQQRMFEKQPLRLPGGGKNLHDNFSESVMDSSQVPPSPTKRIRMDYGQPGGVATAFPHVNTAHIELRHRANTAERMEQQSVHSQSHHSLHPQTHPRLLGRRRLSSDDGLAAGRAPSSAYERHSTGALIGMAGLYNHGSIPAIPVPCSVPSLAAGSAILSRLQQRRNSTGGAEGIGDGLGQSPHQHPASISSLPRRRSMDPDDVFLLDEEGFETRKAAGGDCRLLWDFLVQLLKNETYKPYIRWEDRRERVFRILDPVQIANLWGLQKNRTNMTYEKLSRALRYYYKMGILQKEQGQKLTYRFLQDPKDIANSQRFSKMARNKDNAEHSEVTGSTTTSPIHHFSATSSSTSPQMLSSSPLTSASTSTSSSSSLRSSSMMSSSMAPSPLSSSRGYCLSTPGPHSSSIHHVYPDPKDTCQSSSIGQRSSVHMASTSSTPSPSPPAAADDPVAIATHQMEGVSMMALASPWQGGTSGASDTKGQGLKVKEEPSSRPNSPGMVC